jgi:hypothetical protein
MCKRLITNGQSDERVFNWPEHLMGGWELETSAQTKYPGAVEGSL